MATDHDRRVRPARQRANYISGTLIDCLLLNRAPSFAEKIANCGLTLSGLTSPLPRRFFTTVSITRSTSRVCAKPKPVSSTVKPTVREILQFNLNTINESQFGSKLRIPLVNGQQRRLYVGRHYGCRLSRSLQAGRARPVCRAVPPIPPCYTPRLMLGDRVEMPDEPPPFFGTWPRVYTFVLVYLAALIVVFYAFTRYFS